MEGLTEQGNEVQPATIKPSGGQVGKELSVLIRYVTRLADEADTKEGRTAD